MGLVDILKAKLGYLADDGSKEVAQQYIDAMQQEVEMHGLIHNPGFQKLLDLLKSDFVSRVQKLVESDPELRATKRMFVRTIGSQGAEEQIKKHIEEYLEQDQTGS